MKNDHALHSPGIILKQFFFFFLKQSENILKNSFKNEITSRDSQLKRYLL